MTFSEWLEERIDFMDERADAGSQSHAYAAGVLRQVLVEHQQDEKRRRVAQIQDLNSQVDEINDMLERDQK